MLIHYQCPYAVRQFGVLRRIMGIIPVCKITKKQQKKYWEYCSNCVLKPMFVSGEMKKQKRIKKLKKPTSVQKVILVEKHNKKIS
jgi:hypothetical protein